MKEGAKEVFTTKGTKVTKKRGLTTKVTKVNRMISEPFVFFVPSW